MHTAEENDLREAAWFEHQQKIEVCVDTVDWRQILECLVQWPVKFHLLHLAIDHTLYIVSGAFRHLIH